MIPFIYLLVVFHVYTLQIPKFWNTDGHMQQFYGNCQTPKMKNWFKIFLFPRKVMLLFQIFFSVCDFSVNPHIKIFHPEVFHDRGHYHTETSLVSI